MLHTETPAAFTVRTGQRPYTVRGLILAGLLQLVWHRGRPYLFAPGAERGSFAGPSHHAKGPDGAVNTGGARFAGRGLTGRAGHATVRPRQGHSPAVPGSAVSVPLNLWFATRSDKTGTPPVRAELAGRHHR